jgi:gamma-glutamylcyclotransferase (GGCT)/AIG2-like uncharacterized protein YtfP
MAQPATSLIFAYGTLMTGECRHAALRGQHLRGEALTQPLYRMVLCDDYPGLLEAPVGGVSIQGELWEVDRPTLAMLDEIEGVAENWFARREIALLSPASLAHVVEAYFYLGNPQGLPDCGPSWRDRNRT